MSFMLEYRARNAPEMTGVWGPFDTRSEADNFGHDLGAPGAAWVVVQLRDPNAYTFPEVT